MPTLNDLHTTCSYATPGPWWYDSGNGQIESSNREKGYYRAVVCERAESFRYDASTKESTDPRYEMCPNAKRIHPESDMEFIATFNPALVEKLITVARCANEALGRDMTPTMLALGAALSDLFNHKYGP